MANLPTLEEVNEIADFIWIRKDYSRKVIFPIQEGLKYIRYLGAGTMILEGNSEADYTIKRNDVMTEFGFLTKAEIQEIIAGQELLGGIPDGN